VIQELYIKGFKRFEMQSLCMKPLTVLAGRNGSGKTSVIHAILLVHHALRRHDGIAELNGPFGLELGWFEDVLNANTRENAFSISVRNDTGDNAKWTFAEGDTELYASVEGPQTGIAPLDGSESRRFQYLAAERDGPRITQRASALPTEMLTVGYRGEFCAQVLEKLGSSILDNSRLFPDSEAPPLLKGQTEQWLSKIARDVEIDTARFAGSDVTSLSFRSPGGSWVRPTNMGFGVSYSLPIVLGALTAATGGLLLVESPEAHLHPAGQSEMGMFLAKMSSAGIQVIVETHSDHVLNGFRRAIGESRILPAGDAIVHFFSDVEGAVQALAFTPTGGVSDWPPGFFDQYQLDVARISRIKRNR
jgi:predicted ATPase